MRSSAKPVRRVIVALATMAAGLSLTALPASAQDVTSGTFTLSGDPGDDISQGRAYKYATEAGDRLRVFGGGDGNHISVQINGAQGDFWGLDLAAPQGQVLKPGVYTGAKRYPFQDAAEPGLSVGGNGRGCNTLTGTFTIQNVVFDRADYVQTLDATFEQHCEGREPALRGTVHIANPPRPIELDLGLELSADGEADPVSGNAVVHGTVSCTVAAKVSIGGMVYQVQGNDATGGFYSTQVECAPGTPVPWAVSVGGHLPFKPGTADVDASASAHDPVYNRDVFRDDAETVTLH